MRWQIFPAARKARGAAALPFTRSVYCPIIGGADLQCSNAAAAAAPLPFFSLFPLSRAEMERTVPLVARSVRGLLITPAVALHGGGGGDARCRTRNRARLAREGAM